MLTFTQDNTQAWIDYDHEDGEGRTVYRYSFLHNGIELIEPRTDLRSGVNGGTLIEGMRSLASFLSAWLEGLEHESRTGRESENGHLFPATMAMAAVDWSEFAYGMSSAIGEGE